MMERDEADTGPARGAGLLWLCAVAAALLLLVLNLFHGELNQDEGWYLYAGLRTAEGQQPYADFAFTQGPVMARAYALAAPAVRRWGVAGGRWVTAGLGVLACLAAVRLARRIGGGGAAPLWCFMLLAVNVYQWRHFTMVKTYALCALLLTSGFLWLTYRRARWGRGALLLAGVFMALAAATRSSAAAVLPVAALWLACVDGRDRAGLSAPGCVRAAWFGGGAAAGLAAAFGPVLLRAPDGAWFGLAAYHTARETGGLLSALAYKAGFVSRVVQAYFVTLGVLLAALFLPRGGGCGRGAGGRLRSDAALLYLAAAAVTALHLLAPFPYDDYQVIVYPLLCAAVACSVSGSRFRVPGFGVRDVRLCAVVFVLCLAAAFSSPINQAWFVAGRDRIWWPLREQTPLAQLREAARFVTLIVPEGEPLLTQDIYLAVEAGRRVPAGMELGPFCYFPGLTREEAEARRVLNRGRLRRLLAEAPAPAAALSGWSFAIRAPAIDRVPEAERREFWRMVEARYGLLREFENFGQGRTALRVYRRRAGG
ncbi:MAG: hypothetical protein JW951_09170 [Lentisphaerae bacterium]|nr:hypothetical protein [Lentisphaerota bacterium]